MAVDTDNKKETIEQDNYSGESKVHPVGTAAGAVVGATGGFAGAAAIGAATGSVAGPVGTAAGAAIGGIVGGLAGQAIAEGINPSEEEAYWRENYRSRNYVDKNADYDTYGPAYRYGVDAFIESEGREFDEVEPKLGNDWDSVRGESSLNWNKAKPATRDAYDRLYNSRKVPDKTSDI